MFELISFSAVTWFWIIYASFGTLQALLIYAIFISIGLDLQDTISLIVFLILLFLGIAFWPIVTFVLLFMSAGKLLSKTLK